MRGYAGKFLEVDLSTGKIQTIKLSDDVLRTYIGGRGLAAKILWDRLGSKWDEVDPLGPENILLVLTGPLTGYYPGGRTCISGKSPQSNGIVGSTIAGEFGVELRCAGWDGIIITGRAAKPSYLFIFDSDVEIKSARHLWGKLGKETLRILLKEGRAELFKRKPRYGEWKNPDVLYIGPAGEKKSRIAVVNGKWSHAAGYGGYGGVMGSKNLKAIVAKGSGPLPEAYDPKRTAELLDKVCRDCMDNDAFRRWGTGYIGFDAGNRTSSEPVRNWQEEWHDKRTFAADRFEERVWIKRYWGDFGCPTTCYKVGMCKVGPFKGAIDDNPDYELQAYLGTNLGIFTPEENVYVASVMDDLGICGINGGNVLGFAGELYQRKILTRKDLGGISLKWGDAKAFAALAHKIARREGIGDVLAEGSYRAALKLGRKKRMDLTKYVVHGKAIACGAHGIRSHLDFPTDIAYACSVQGGDHTSVAQLPLEGANSELRTLLYDSGVFCWFNVFAVDEPIIWEFLEAVTGWGITKEEWYSRLAPSTINIQRAALLIGGPDLKWRPREDDENPPRFYEPLPSGPKKGEKIVWEKFDEMRREYYQALGWDERGIPKTETLKALGLADVDRVLREKLKEK
ncbi:aldehyde ferredoxin oxidoreductase [Candidatus Bathyarchaeota archaeon]|nr:aldehyde ferredoxin oxidoreductase [Candidatus Bathyarchaeota archaeon]